MECLIFRRLTLNGIQRRLLILRVEVPDPLAKDDGKLNLVMQVNTPGPDHRALTGEQDRRGRLLEEEGLLRPGAVELGDMVPECKSATSCLSTIRANETRNARANKKEASTYA